MEILNHNTHPIFEADQILTSKHLNDVFNYLEEQERMTRAELIGSGIVCGLNISYKNTPEEKSIFISKGIGVTSDGSLMALCNGQAGTGNFDLDDNKEYAYFKTYRDPLVPDDSIQSNDSIYPFFLRGNTQIDLYELHNENEAGFESLDNFLGETGKDLAEFGVLLYLECHDVELKNCIENDCNEKGIERNFILRKLLISKEDLEFIIKKEATELSQNASISDIDDHVNGRYFLETFNLPRLKLSPADVTSQDQFLANYQGYITSALAEMENYLLPNIKYLQPVLRKELSADANFNFLNSFFSTVRSKVPDTDICYVQYLYDFLSDVTETHNELVEAAFELISACCPPLDRFPKHLRLGDLVSEDRCIPTPYRSTFTPSPIHNHGYQQKQKVISLYKKLEAITTSFRIPTELQTIKITPSAALNEPLSKRAIPYYYDLTKDLLKSWNYDHTRKYKSTRNLSYLASSYDTLGVGRTPAHVLNPLNYGLNKCNFFRIEGHVCKNYEVALKEIIGIRDLHNLPFDVITLKLSRDAQGTTFEKAVCNFRDLEVLCKAWKSELQCLLGKVIGKLSNVRLRDTVRELPVDLGSPEVVDDVLGEVTLKDDVFVGSIATKRVLGDFTKTPMLGKLSLLETKNYQPEVFNYVSDQVVKEEETLGYMINKAMVDEKDICKYDIKGNEYLQAELVKIPGYEYLNIEDMMVAFQDPLALSVSLLDFSKAMDKDCQDLDLEELETKIKEMNRRAAIYLKNLNNYKAATIRRVNVDVEAMTQITTVLSTNCSFQSLKEILHEMERRKNEILEMNLFSEYLKKNPGVEHKSGVPKAGTFALIYADKELSKITVYPAAEDQDPKTFAVHGAIADASGAALPGVSILIKGTTTGTTTDFDGNFKMRVPRGTQILEIFYSGYQNEAVTVTGASNVIIQLGSGETVTNPGMVVGDFFVPYLCCSACPPVAYIFPDKKEVLPEEQVGLDISRRSFCAPTTNDPHVFIVTPEDGTVTLDGTEAAGVIKKEDSFFFDANRIDLGNEVSKTINSFKVNDKAVGLSITVEKQPDATFKFDTEWMLLNEANKKLLPVLTATITNFNEKFTYAWKVSAFIDGTAKLIAEQKHNPDSATPSSQSIQLPEMKEGTPLQVELTATNIKCTDSKKAEGKLNKKEIPDEIEFQLRLNEVVQKEPFVFSQGPDQVVTIFVKPAGEFQLDGFSKTLALKKQVSNNKEILRYDFSPTKKPAGKYPLTFLASAGGQKEVLEIIIKGQVSPGTFTHVGDLSSLTNNADLIRTLGTDSVGFRNTINVAAALDKRLNEPVLVKTIAGGNFNKNFVATLEPAMRDVSEKLVSAKTAKDKKAVQSLYQFQLITLAEMIKAQNKDITASSELSKMITDVNKQLRAIKKAGVKITGSKKMMNTIVKIANELEGKPFAKKQLNLLAKNVNS